MSTTEAAGVTDGRNHTPKATNAGASAPSNDHVRPLPHGSVTVDELTLAAELSGDTDAIASADVAEYALWLGDDALILSQQLGWWIARAPELEEDVALGNIALDLLGHARSLLRYAGTADGRTEDELAYFRDEPQFRSAWIVEQPNGDFAQTIARQLVTATYMFELYSALRHSDDPTLAAIAEKSLKEVDYHRDHAIQWTLRLAGGTDESRTRTIRAVDAVWPYVDELFHDEPLLDRLNGIAARPSALRDGFDAIVNEVFAEAELEIPKGFISSGGGRHGSHFSTLGFILAEMQVLARQHPGATW
ncbi:phenylacetate-CoA oxygenase [Microbacterium sp. CH12i]|uniref:1,2-phenylacetyl-CoA epoxidase subunit PaaC n=1 Tax=Microbacterium sp. CH12i TaxID=1479651 RepID=UPI000461DA45|nr:1,2-phenylacetyl-CoA epoxidase subunit PaaC [Microbacterium sp. CH12i]KDA06573.1 phenylacetate-CoA oxygenase [Microbacterium sp. CH12i]